MQGKKQARDVTTPEYDALARPLFARAEQNRGSDSHALLTDAVHAGLPDLYNTHLLRIMFPAIEPKKLKDWMWYYNDIKSRVFAERLRGTHPAEGE